MDDGTRSASGGGLTATTTATGGHPFVFCAPHLGPYLPVVSSRLSSRAFAVRATPLFLLPLGGVWSGGSVRRPHATRTHRPHRRCLSPPLCRSRRSRRRCAPCVVSVDLPPANLLRSSAPTGKRLFPRFRCCSPARLSSPLSLPPPRPLPPSNPPPLRPPPSPFPPTTLAWPPATAAAAAWPRWPLSPLPPWAPPPAPLPRAPCRAGGWGRPPSPPHPPPPVRWR